MIVTVGSRIGPYEVLAPLGTGGMGEVFRARDSRLGRDVALKALPEAFAADPERLARFEREARLLASLSHPNISSIYGLEQVADQRFLVLELVEGETLASRLVHGAIPADEALPIAIQIATAVEVAHEAGVVHRDLKPGNVMVRPDGTVKVLDFGLARAATDDPASAEVMLDSPTVTSPVRLDSPTTPGVILGTAGYMSPEQARGKPVDKRSDIFSFGCVLYELLAGARPFPGESVVDSLGAIIHREPDWALLPPATPPRIRELLANCLAKDRRNRLRDIGDARLELERAVSGREWGAATAAAPARPRLTLGQVALAAAAALLLLAGGWLLSARLAPRVAPPRMTSLIIPSRTAAYRQASESVISPDGRFVAFTARANDTGQRGLWLRPLDSFEARPLAEAVGAAQPFWSWDSRSVAFHTDGKLWSVDVARGGARRLIAAEPGNYGAAWGPTGDIILSRLSGATRLVRIPAGGGPVEPLFSLDAETFERVHAFPHFLPDGNRYLFLGVSFNPDQEVRTGRLYVGRIGSHDRTRVADILSSSWYCEPGRLVYVEDGTIKAASFDAGSLRITGEAVTIADGVTYFKPFGASRMSVANDGTIAFVPPEDQQQLVWFDAGGSRLGTMGPQGSFEGIRISPDGSQVAVGVADRRTGASDIWLYGTGRATATHLTSDARWEGNPIWSPDGSTVYFSWDRSDEPQVYAIRADGSGGVRDIYGKGSGGGVWFPRDVSPDGTTLLTDGRFPKLGRDLMQVRLRGDGVAVPFRSTPASETGGRFSPDGRWLAYNSSESGATEVYLAPYPGPGPRVQVSEGGAQAVWSPTGTRLYYLRRTSDVGAASDLSTNSAIMVVDLGQPGAFHSPPPPRVLFETAERIVDFDAAPDGKRFLVQLEPVDSQPIHVILNGLAGKR